MLGFLFRHYDPLVQRFVVYDDGSTDDSLEILRSNPKVEVRPTPPYSDPDSRILSGTSILECCWKESRGVADWVIVTDIDEHLYHHRDLEGYLKTCKERGVTIIPALGYQMLAEEFPKEGIWLCRSVTMGAPWHKMNKLNIFAPDEIESTNYQPGRHRAALVGNVVAPARDELLLLHYKFLGFDAPNSATSSTGAGRGKRTSPGDGASSICGRANNYGKNGDASRLAWSISRGLT
jgi:Glycosyl transferase family 2